MKDLFGPGLGLAVVVLLASGMGANAEEIAPFEETPIVLQASQAVPAELAKSEYHQVADRVAVLLPVQAPNRDAARIRILRIELEDPPFDPIRNHLALLRGRLKVLLGRRHELGPHVLPHPQRGCCLWVVSQDQML